MSVQIVLQETIQEVVPEVIPEIVLDQTIEKENQITKEAVIVVVTLRKDTLDSL